MHEASDGCSTGGFCPRGKGNLVCGHLYQGNSSNPNDAATVVHDAAYVVNTLGLSSTLRLGSEFLDTVEGQLETLKQRLENLDNEARKRYKDAEPNALSASEAATILRCTGQPVPLTDDQEIVRRSLQILQQKESPRALSIRDRLLEILLSL